MTELITDINCFLSQKHFLDANDLDDNEIFGRHVFTNIFLTCIYCLIWGG